MLIIIISSLCCLFLTYLDSIGKFKMGLSVSFLILTFLAAVHYDYGNDYMAYYELYDYLTVKYSTFDFSGITEGDYKDYGWVFLCLVFMPFGGFFTMVAVLSLIQNLLIFLFIKREVQKSWWPISVFIYLFVTNYYLLNFSMLRQGFVVCVFLGLWTFIREKKWWIPFSVLSFCFTIHGSSIILLPFSFWGFIPKNFNRLVPLIYGLLFLFFSLSVDFLSTILQNFLVFDTIEDYAETYSKTQQKVTFGLGYLLGLIPFFIGEYYLLTTKDDIDKRQIVMLALLAFLITPFYAVIPLISRVGIYFGIYQIAAMPLIFRTIRNKELRVSLMLSWICLILYNYWVFFTSSVYAIPYSDFRTIFEVM